MRNNSSAEKKGLNDDKMNLHEGYNLFNYIMQS